MEQNKIKAIKDCGQSIWLDFFDRQIMNTGKLKKLIEDDGIRGVTANPSIFEKAINSSSDYEKKEQKAEGAEKKQEQKPHQKKEKKRRRKKIRSACIL